MPAKRSHRVPLEQHREQSGSLRSIKDALWKIQDTACSTYGKSGNEARAVARALDAVDKLRCVLDSAVFREHPELGMPHLANVYYGKRED